jgi:hypothetical protein
MVPVTVLICFMVQLLGDREPKLVPRYRLRQTLVNDVGGASVGIGQRKKIRIHEGFRIPASQPDRLMHQPAMLVLFDGNGDG